MKTVRVGVMPGRINEYALEVGATVGSALEVAGLDAKGYDVKVDGLKITDLNQQITDSTNLILLVKQVKGNANGTVRIGVMPGRINEYALETGITVREALEMAELDSKGYDVKVDGVKVDLDHKVTDSTNLIMLVKQVKGN